MLYEAIDTLWVAVADLSGAVASYERVGLRLSPLEDPHVRGRSFRVGPDANRVTAQLLTDPDAGAVPQLLHEPIRRARAAGRGLFAVGLRVRDLPAALAQLAARGIEALRGQLQAGDARPLADLGWLPLADRAGTDLVLIQHAGAGTEEDAPEAAAAGRAHRLPLKRLDHLAAVASDLDGQTRFWVEVLGVPLAGEVTTPTLIIRQFRIGDAILELLGPASADSPIQQRPRGLVSLASWEVDDLDAVVRQVRAVGFHPSDPVVGALPGTRTATIPAPELAGWTMQLLEYV